MPRTTGPAGTTVARAVAFALIQARPDPEWPGARVAHSQWEADVLAVSLALKLLYPALDDTKFRRACEGPKGDA